MLDQLRAHIEKIVPLDDQEFELMTAFFTYKKFKKHQFLTQEGEPVTYNYFVVKGLLKLVYTDDTGKEHIVAFAMEDWWETDFPAFYQQTKATMSLLAVEDTEVLCISLQDYKKLCAALPKIEHFFLEKAYMGFIAAQQRIISTMTTGIKERYEQLLQKYPSLIQRVPKTLLAAYLGVSRETLSRLSL
ncbi:Crp/Fnr family transcriptional regulator [Chryseobacterium indologenes]|uniref:Crp/Fnr family transcriptional regulator n=1 Tax=Chryseobacterium indologenes TaxID=253 RepID=A0AAD1DUP4_CHRID|nr:MULTISPECIES: Crp/Fnr family transcriptional regulator [Chryseobacterium]AYY86464.1 Crp/Fnr family transcriptional regulator [Chryseobacterium indologenes]AYZ36342.1 Crp/Fnr family transcriptional regulator [Chryseobacterium indologenes]AZB16422.1 Crp/Fnr family transcriptional regulator [Chryseobacterium indologenes]MBF6644998.1 Crp/Fnr family transcriptional regulator [Chryseobacterium indologenes]MBU3050168.1 Crp/Fnr family transcriptional regulator [Chryseobacterium indologenes]